MVERIKILNERMKLFKGDACFQRDKTLQHLR